MSKMQGVLARYKAEMEMQKVGTHLGVSGGTKFRNGLDFVPVDAYKAELHSNTEVHPFKQGDAVIFNGVTPATVRFTREDGLVEVVWDGKDGRNVGTFHPSWFKHA